LLPNKTSLNTQQNGRVSLRCFIPFTLIMNNFMQRYSTTNSINQLRRVQRLADEDQEFSDATWGSAAGFGNLAKGSPAFIVPDVPDVSC
jgi:hypothetical protein